MLEVWKFIEDEIVGNFGAIDEAIIPAVAEAAEMVGVDVGEYVDVSVEGVLLALAKVVDDDVSEIDFSHFAAKVPSSL